MTTKEVRESGLTVVRTVLPHVQKGTCFLYFAFELGLAIDLDQAAQRIKIDSERASFRRTRRTPKYFDYDPPPVRVIQHCQQLNVGKFFTKPQVEVTMFDFGACSVSYEIDIVGPVAHLIELSEVLYDNAFLLADARERVRELMNDVGPAINRPSLSESVEDLTVYHIECFESELPFTDIIEQYPREFARMLRAESGELADEEVRDTLATRTSYSSGDLLIIDWNAAVFFGPAVEDAAAVLEFCNVELLEMRHLDEQLDDSLEKAYQILVNEKKGGADIHKVARLQVDSAILYEAVENALKLLGDQYLARLYSLASKKLHLPEWNTSILRKLDTLDSIYQKMSDRAAQRRSELLEWIIIVLILFEIIWGVVEKVWL
jgi:hypothetical protein